MLLSMDMRLSVRHGIARGIQLFWRENKWGSTFLMLLGIAVLLQMLIVCSLAVAGVRDVLKAQSAIHVEVTQGVADEDIQRFYAAVKALPYVENVLYIPREKAYENEQARNPDLISTLQQFHLSNPFPDSFSVTLASLDAYDQFKQFAGQAQWKAVVNPSFLPAMANQEEQIQRELALTRTLGTVTSALTALTVVVLLGMIVNVSRQRAMRRKEELLLESVLGMSPMDVLLPFVTELAVLLLCALAAGTAFVVLLLLVAPMVAPDLVSGATFGELRDRVMPLLLLVFPLIVLGEAVALPVLGAVGSALGVPLKRMWPTTRFS